MQTPTNAIYQYNIKWKAIKSKHFDVYVFLWLRKNNLNLDMYNA